MKNLQWLVSEEQYYTLIKHGNLSYSTRVLHKETEMKQLVTVFSLPPDGRLGFKKMVQCTMKHTFETVPIGNGYIVFIELELISNQYKNKNQKP